jgi:hypothetical protein
MTTFVDNSNTPCGNTAITDTKLVHAVEKHPALYNPKRRGYKDTAEMDRSWLLIANELGMKRKSLTLIVIKILLEGGGTNRLLCTILIHAPQILTPLSYRSSLLIPLTLLPQNLNHHSLSPVLIIKLPIYPGLQS